MSLKADAVYNHAAVTRDAVLEALRLAVDKLATPDNLDREQLITLPRVREAHEQVAASLYSDWHVPSPWVDLQQLRNVMRRLLTRVELTPSEQHDLGTALCQAIREHVPNDLR